MGSEHPQAHERYESIRHRAELARALVACFEDPPADETGQRSLARIAAALGLPPLPDRAEHTEVFVLELPPYASVYLGTDGMIGGEAAAQVAGFWRAIGTGEPREPDHLVDLLALYASLLDAEADALCSASSAVDRSGHADRPAADRPAADRPAPDRPAADRPHADPPTGTGELLGRAATTLLMEHIASWLVPYLNALARQSSGFYRALADTLSLFVEAEVRNRQPANLDLESWCSTYVPPLLAEPPDPPSPEGGGRAFVASLLVPARSGMILTRSRLAACASRSGAAMRLGERRLALETMLGEQPREVLEWLRDEALEWTRLYRSAEPLLGDIARAWSARSEATARALESELRHLAA